MQGGVRSNTSSDCNIQQESRDTPVVAHKPRQASVECTTWADTEFTFLVKALLYSNTRRDLSWWNRKGNIQRGQNELKCDRLFVCDTAQRSIVKTEERIVDAKEIAFILQYVIVSTVFIKALDSTANFGFNFLKFLLANGRRFKEFPKKRVTPQSMVIFLKFLS